MGEIRTFRDLIAWQKAMGLAKSIDQITATMPESERFGLIAQMRRAAVSIPSNIAEGYARQSGSDYVRFLRVARGSLAELATQHDLAVSLELLSENAGLLDQRAETDRVLQGLIRSVEQTL